MRDVKGTVTFEIKDGLLAEYTVEVSATRQFGDNEFKQTRVTTTTFSPVDSAQASLPKDAKEILDSLAAGRTPNVFVPEPGFKKLFNGHDLAGWEGRPGHWSVQDGAITGREGPEVRAALDRTDGQVKLAALVLHGLTPDDAAALLDRAGGHLRIALAQLANDRRS